MNLAWFRIAKTFSQNFGADRSRAKKLASISPVAIGAFLMTLSPAAIAATPNANSPVGTNLAGINALSTELPFLDAFKSSTRWFTMCTNRDLGCTNSNMWNTGEEDLLNLDPQGWVKSLPSSEDAPIYTRVSTYLFQGMKGRYPSGQYVVLYEGEGTIEYHGDARKNLSSPGRDLIDINADNGRGVMLTITKTDPQKTGNYIRNIKVVKLEYESQLSQGFNPKFIEKIDKFKAIRFMDWMKTNNSKQQNWQGRPTRKTASYALSGVPLETMVSLSNRISADPWFNMPHMANDEYITNFASTVKRSLSPKLKVYVEYSNEVWNPQFSQYSWVGEQANKEWPISAHNTYTKVANWHGKRTAQICQIWKRSFGTQSHRVVCVMGAQATSEWQSTQALDCPLWINKPCYKHGINAMAIAPYFGGHIGAPNNQSELETWTLDRLFQELEQGGQLISSSAGSVADKSYTAMLRNFNIASQRNLDMLAYEGGQHLVGRGGVENNQTITNLLIAANQDPRMYNLYTNYLSRWKSSGGKLFMNFSSVGAYSKWGSWGTLEYIDQNGSPKYNAVVDFIKTNPCWWNNCASSF
ncbi:MAG: cellulose-binding protein [Cyanosarcina radialis HA8281-LM2]|jgi:hypothetical protein|nr:cellulose-binding protein [Cyanosarcina radialis HA8281-LM2]